MRKEKVLLDFIRIRPAGCPHPTTSSHQISKYLKAIEFYTLK
jgi:hypothetical protein